MQNEVLEYKYDLHVHSMETSSCGHMYISEVLDYYYREGYSGLAVTDHFSDEHFRLIGEHEKSWEDRITRFLLGYRTAIKRAAELNMDVILGIELRFPESSRDYLVFGIDEEFLYRNPYCYESSPSEFFTRFGDEVIILQAHPFRVNRATGAYNDFVPTFMHGVEFNTNPRKNNYNDRVIAVCREHPEFICINGSDVHQPVDLCSSYTSFKQRIRDSVELKDALISREYVLGFT